MNKQLEDINEEFKSFGTLSTNSIQQLLELANTLEYQLQEHKSPYTLEA